MFLIIVTLLYFFLFSFYMYFNIMLNLLEILYDMFLICINILKLFLNNVKILFFKVNKIDKNEISIFSFLCEW